MSKSASYAIFAEAVQNVGWIAKFSAPGRVPTPVTDRAGRPEVFATRAEAMAQAGICLCAALNGARVKQTFVAKSRTAVVGAEAGRVFAALK